MPCKFLRLLFCNVHVCPFLIFRRQTSSTNTPTLLAVPSGIPLKPEPARRKSSQLASAFPSMTPSGSVGVTPTTVKFPPAPMRTAAKFPPKISPTAGQARRGRVRVCMRTCSPRCRLEPSRAWMTTSFLLSSSATLTRALKLESWPESACARSFDQSVMPPSH